MKRIQNRGRGIARRACGKTLGVVACVCLFASMQFTSTLAAQQPTGKPLTFEVASIRPHKFEPGGSRLGMFIAGSTVNVFTTTLKRLVMAAYDVKDYQILGGPDWITGPGGNDTYDITARVAGDVTPTPAQAREMLKMLLAERFQLKLKSEKREMPLYVLTVGKNGHKLKPADDSSRSSSDTSAGRMIASRMTMAQLANILTGRLGKPVMDSTGLDGNYSFTLESPEMDFVPSRGLNSTSDVSGPSLFTAVDEQLGLKLTSGKGNIDVLVIERVEKPSEN